MGEGLPESVLFTRCLEQWPQKGTTKENKDQIGALGFLHFPAVPPSINGEEQKCCLQN